MLYSMLPQGDKEVIKMRPLKSKVSMTIDDDILEKLKILAEEDDRPLSQYINRVLRAHVKEVSEKKEDRGGSSGSR